MVAVRVGAHAYIEQIITKQQAFILKQVQGIYNLMKRRDKSTSEESNSDGGMDSYARISEELKF